MLEKKYDEFTGYEINSEIVIKSTLGKTFSAYHSATDYLKNLGYTVGRLECNYPVPFAKNCQFIGKWSSVERWEYCKMDGIIVSNDFREGDVTLIFFEK